MSRSPHYAMDMRWGKKLGDASLKDSMFVDGLSDPLLGIGMGETAERIADKHGITRAEQDAFAALSQRRVSEADFSREIIAVADVSRDEHPRADTTIESLAKLKPAFRKEGTVTGGNATGIKDGDELGPYPIKLSRDRVTVEEAPVTFVKPDSPLLTFPNNLTPADFDGWGQERGLYFAGSWDPRYETVLATHDPGESDKPGGLLYAKVGKGAWVYTGYAFFRQLPAGVPGAYRLLANLLALGRSGAERQAAFAARGQELADRFLVVDTHIDVPYRLKDEMEDVSQRTARGDFDYPRAVAGGLDTTFMSIYIPAKLQDSRIARALPPGAPLVVATGNVDGLPADVAHEGPIVQVVRKPFELADVLAALVKLA